jgi:hypothetical protein
MKKVVLVVVIIVLLLITVLFARFFLGRPEDAWVCEYGRWVKHGNPSAPMPTAGCGSALVDKVEENLTDSSVCYSPNGNKMTYEQALEKAVGCKDGELQETHFCNDSTGTWWIDFVPNEVKDGCNPACVVFVDTGETEINWRCTGLREPSM